MNMSRSYFSDWKTTQIKCLKCDWTGLGSELEQGEIFDYLFEMDCPKCGEHVTTINHPSNEESRKHWDMLPPEEKLLVEINESLHTNFEKHKLSSPDQLPDLPGDDLIIYWDMEFRGDTIFGSNTIIRFGDLVIWREPVFFEGYKRFLEVAGILSNKYGTRLRDFIQTKDSEGYLYGDKFGAPYEIENCRQTIRGELCNSQKSK
jgi:hypothetical protein